MQIYASQIQVTVEGDPVDDVPTLRNAAQNLMAVALDALSWAFGRAYSIEVTSLTADNGDLTVFGVDFGPIESKRASQQPLDVGAVYEKVLEEPEFARAISDLRQALREPLDSAFHCQRAVECLRTYFQHDECSDAEAWERLRAALNISRQYLDEVKPYGDRNRHGWVVDMSADERTDVIMRSWEVVDRFFDYLVNSKQPLSGPERPLL